MALVCQYMAEKSRSQSKNERGLTCLQSNGDKYTEIMIGTWVLWGA